MMFLENFEKILVSIALIKKPRFKPQIRVQHKIFNKSICFHDFSIISYNNKGFSLFFTVMKCLLYNHFENFKPCFWIQCAVYYLTYFFLSENIFIGYTINENYLWYLSLKSALRAIETEILENQKIIIYKFNSL